MAKTRNATLPDWPKGWFEVTLYKLLNQITISLRRFTDYYTKNVPRKFNARMIIWSLQLIMGFSLIFMGLKIILVALRGW